MASSSSSPTKKMIKLQTSDNQIFEVEESIMLQSQTIKFMIEDDCSDGVTPLSNVTSNVLSKIIEYCTKHASQPAFDPDTDKRPFALRMWDYGFINVDPNTLFELVKAANYLDIKSLLHLASKTVADKLKGKTSEEMRQTFNIKNDFSPEEEEEIKKENQWTFE